METNETCTAGTEHRWEPVPGDMGRYACASCGVLGRKIPGTGGVVTPYAERGRNVKKAGRAQARWEALQAQEQNKRAERRTAMELRVNAWSEGSGRNRE